MTRVPQIRFLADGRRLHLQDGPIDLIVEANGSAANVHLAYEAAARRFTGLLDELCGELVELRKATDPARCALKGVVARRMHAAVAPFATDCFITPMAAVAGSVAEEILGALARIQGLRLIARTSSFQFKGDNRDIRQIAKQLGAECILEGSVRRAGNRIGGRGRAGVRDGPRSPACRDDRQPGARHGHLEQLLPQPTNRGKLVEVGPYPVTAGHGGQAAAGSESRS